MVKKNNPCELKKNFLRWQCRVRQITMREKQGKPDSSIMPEIQIKQKNMGKIITVFNKRQQYSKIPEMKHIAQHTCDPAQRRDKALTFFSEYYYQNIEEFSDVLTASFQQNSIGAKNILKAQYCNLKFTAYSQQFSLHCKAVILKEGDTLYQATWWHNYLFNPNLPGNNLILGFNTDWKQSCEKSEQ